MTVDGIWIKIGGDITGFKNSIKQIEGLAENLQAKIDRTARGSNMLASGLAAIGAAGAAAGLGAVKLAADFERSEIAFTNLLKTKKAAKEFMAQIEAFADVTPFESKDLYKSAQMMIGGAKMAAKKVIPYMTAIGDAVANAGGDASGVQNIVKQLTQSIGKGRILQEELSVIAENGMPGVVGYMAAGLKMDEKAFRNLVSKGAVPAYRAIEGMIVEAEKANKNAMAMQANTLWGLWSTIMEKMHKTGRIVGQAIVDTFNLKGVQKRVIDVLTGFSGMLAQKGLKGGLAELFPSNLRARIALIAGAIGGALVPALIAAALHFTLLYGPLIPFALAGAYIVKHWDKVGPMFQSIGKFLARPIQLIKDFLGIPNKELTLTTKTKNLTGPNRMAEPSPVQKLGARFVDGWRRIWAQIAGFASVLARPWTRVFDRIQESMKPLAKQWKDIGAAIADSGLLKLLGQIGLAIVFIANNALAGILALIPGIIKSFTGFTQQFAGIALIIKGIFTLDGDMISRGWRLVLDGLKNMFSAPLDHIKALFSNTWGAVTDAFVLAGLDIEVEWTLLLARMADKSVSLFDKIKAGVKGSFSSLGFDWDAFVAAGSARDPLAVARDQITSTAKGKKSLDAGEVAVRKKITSMGPQMIGRSIPDAVGDTGRALIGARTTLQRGGWKAPIEAQEDLIVGSLVSKGWSIKSAEAVAAVLQKNEFLKEKAVGTLGKHAGGVLPGKGGGDKIPALLEAGEAIVPHRVVSAGIPAIAAWFSQMGVSQYATGGLAGKAAMPNFNALALKRLEASAPKPTLQAVPKPKVPALSKWQNAIATLVEKLPIRKPYQSLPRQSMQQTQIDNAILAAEIKRGRAYGPFSPTQVMKPAAKRVDQKQLSNLAMNASSRLLDSQVATDVAAELVHGTQTKTMAQVLQHAKTFEDFGLDTKNFTSEELAAFVAADHFLPMTTGAESVFTSMILGKYHPTIPVSKGWISPNGILFNSPFDDLGRAEFERSILSLSARQLSNTPGEALLRSGWLGFSQYDPRSTLPELYPSIEMGARLQTLAQQKGLRSLMSTVHDDNGRASFTFSAHPQWYDSLRGLWGTQTSPEFYEDLLDGRQLLPKLITGGTAGKALLKRVNPAKPGALQPKVEGRVFKLEDYEELFERVRAEDIYNEHGFTPRAYREPGDKLLGELQKMQGFDAPPTIVSTRRMSSLVGDNTDLDIFRGVGTAEQAQAFRTGEYFPGTGIFGQGTYVAHGESGPREAYSYANSKIEAMLRMTHHPDSNYVSNNQDFVAEWLSSRGRTQFLGVPPDLGGLIDQVHSDLGYWATAQGVDGYLAEPRSNYSVIQNRSSMIVQDKAPTKEFLAERGLSWLRYATGGIAGKPAMPNFNALALQRLKASAVAKPAIKPWVAPNYKKPLPKIPAFLAGVASKLLRKPYGDIPRQTMEQTQAENLQLSDEYKRMRAYNQPLSPAAKKIDQKQLANIAMGATSPYDAGIEKFMTRLASDSRSIKPAFYPAIQKGYENALKVDPMLMFDDGFRVRGSKDAGSMYAKSSTPDWLGQFFEGEPAFNQSPKIYLNTHKSPDAVWDLMEQWEKSGYMAKGTGSFEGLVNHEFGHLIQAKIVKNFNLKPYDIQTGIMPRYPADVRTMVSQYANSTSEEFFAEVYSQMTTAPDRMDPELFANLQRFLSTKGQLGVDTSWDEFFELYGGGKIYTPKSYSSSIKFDRDSKYDLTGPTLRPYETANIAELRARFGRLSPLKSHLVNEGESRRQWAGGYQKPVENPFSTPTVQGPVPLLPRKATGWDPKLPTNISKLAKSKSYPFPASERFRELTFWNMSKEGLDAVEMGGLQKKTQIYTPGSAINEALIGMRSPYSGGKDWKPDWKVKQQEQRDFYRGMWLQKIWGLPGASIQPKSPIAGGKMGGYDLWGMDSQTSFVFPRKPDPKPIIPTSVAKYVEKIRSQFGGEGASHMDEVSGNLQGLLQRRVSLSKLTDMELRGLPLVQEVSAGQSAKNLLRDAYEWTLGVKGTYPLFSHMDELIKAKDPEGKIPMGMFGTEVQVPRREGWVSPRGLYFDFDAETVSKEFAKSVLGSETATALKASNRFAAFEPELVNAGWAHLIIDGTEGWMDSKSVLPETMTTAQKRLVNYFHNLENLEYEGFPEFSMGTILPGKGGGDKIPAMLEPGEAVVPHAVVSAGIPTIASWFEDQGVKKYASGTPGSFNGPALQKAAVPVVATKQAASGYNNLLKLVGDVGKKVTTGMVFPWASAQRLVGAKVRGIKDDSISVIRNMNYGVSGQAVEMSSSISNVFDSTWEWQLPAVKPDPGMEAAVDSYVSTINAGYTDIMTGAQTIIVGSNATMVDAWNKLESDAAQSAAELQSAFDFQFDAPDIEAIRLSAVNAALLFDTSKTSVSGFIAELAKITPTPVTLLSTASTGLSTAWNTLKTTGTAIWNELGGAITSAVLAGTGSIGQLVGAGISGRDSFSNMKTAWDALLKGIADGVPVGSEAMNKLVTDFENSKVRAVEAFKQIEAASKVMVSSFVTWLDKGADIKQLTFQLDAAKKAFGDSSPEVTKLTNQIDQLTKAQEPLGVMLRKTALQVISLAEVQVVTGQVAGIVSAIAMAPATLGASLSVIPQLVAQSLIALAVFEGLKAGLRAIPMASGGIVQNPTRALVGEAGPEAIIPLNQLPRYMPQPVQYARTGTDGGGTTINLNFYDTKVWRDSDINDIGSRLVTVLRRMGVKA